MTKWFLAPEAADDLDRLTDFLLTASPDIAIETIDLITDGLSLLARHPCIGRPIPHGLRELVIAHGKSGYLALYSYDEQADVALVLAVRHRRELDYH